MPRNRVPASVSARTSPDVRKRYPSHCAPLVATLGGIVSLLGDQATKTLNRRIFKGHPAKYICTLPDDTLYFWSKDLDVDDDGYNSKEGLILINKPPDWQPDEFYQDQTSLPGLSAFVDPYIVLPFSGNDWYQKKTRCRVGDGAIVIAGSGEWTLAVFGDEGPGNKIGEISLAAHAKFVGWAALFTQGPCHPVPCSVTFERRPKSGPFVTMVFPDTRGTGMYDLSETLENTKRLFWKLAGHKKRPV